MISVSASSRKLLTAYLDGPRVLREAVAGMDADALRARPIEGKLSSLEVVGHIVDSDQFMCDRVKRTVATERPLLVGVESIDYPLPLRYQDRDVELDLKLLEVQREQLAADLARQHAEAWRRVAIHTENGAVTVRELLHHAIEHLEDHVRTIIAKRRALGL